MENVDIRGCSATTVFIIDMTSAVVIHFVSSMFTTCIFALWLQFARFSRMSAAMTWPILWLLYLGSVATYIAQCFYK